MRSITVEENSAVTVRDRLLKEDTTAVQSADVYDIVARVFDLNSSTPSDAVEEITLDIGSVLYDTLQDDDAWSDSTGYNFKWTVDPSWISKGGSHYRVEIQVDIDSGSDLTPTTAVWVRFNVKTVGIGSA